jgi:hypothetical protein
VPDATFTCKGVPGINPWGVDIVNVITDGFAPLLAADATGIDEPLYKSPLLRSVVSVNKLCPFDTPTTPLAQYLRVVTVGASKTINVPSARLNPAIPGARPDMLTTLPATIPWVILVVTVIKLADVLVVVKSVVIAVTVRSTAGNSYVDGYPRTAP